MHVFQVLPPPHHRVSDNLIEMRRGNIYCSTPPNKLPKTNFGRHILVLTTYECTEHAKWVCMETVPRQIPRSRGMGSGGG